MLYTIYHWYPFHKWFMISWSKSYWNLYCWYVLWYVWDCELIRSVKSQLKQNEFSWELNHELITSFWHGSRPPEWFCYWHLSENVNLSESFLSVILMNRHYKLFFTGTYYQLDTLEQNFNKIWNKVPIFLSWKNVVCKMAAILFRLHCVNSSPPGQNYHHFADGIFKCIFLNENVKIQNCSSNINLFPRVQ